MLSDHERFRLLGGPYRMPQCKVGGWLTCRIRGRVRVFAISDGRIQWPMTRQRAGGNNTFIVCGDMARAIERESGQAVAFWWGVTAQTVSAWRKSLGVKQNNRGTIRLRSKWWKEGGTGEAARPGREASQSSLERRAKIAAAKRGKARPRHVIDAMVKGRTGTPQSDETRAKISAANKRRGAYPPAAGRPFTAEDDALLGTAPDQEIAQRLGRSAATIAGRRLLLGIESYRRRTRGW